jgi:5,10-methylenetetrahydromethanopterin reductase
MSKIELWCVANGFPGTTASEAERAEANGWDGLSVPDSQNLTGDPYVALALAASVTSNLLLRPGVTNSFTRHPAVTAASILTVQVESKGRAVFGIGRGDSALAHLGLAPMPVNLFRRYVERVQGYLRGEEMPFDVQTDGKGEVASADALAMASGPKGSKLRWAQYARVPKVPVDAAVTGPKPIAAIAPVVERMTFAVGADPKRIRWALGVAREARRKEDLDPDAVEWGVMLHVSPHQDRRTAIEMISGTVASIARFSVMHGRPLGPMSDTVYYEKFSNRKVFA